MQGRAADLSASLAPLIHLHWGALGQFQVLPSARFGAALEGVCNSQRGQPGFWKL